MIRIRWRIFSLLFGFGFLAGFGLRPQPGFSFLDAADLLCLRLAQCFDLGSDRLGPVRQLLNFSLSLFAALFFKTKITFHSFNLFQLFLIFSVQAIDFCEQRLLPYSQLTKLDFGFVFCFFRLSQTSLGFFDSLQLFRLCVLQTFNCGL